MMMVPDPANMPPTPWQTEILASGIWAGAVLRIWRTFSCPAAKPARCSLPGASFAGNRGRARPQPGSRHDHHRLGSSKVAFRVVGARRVDVEIDDLHAALRLLVAVAGMPRSIAETNIADLGEPETTPLTSGRQTLLALAAKLIGQRFLLPL
jgi:hypothetical protein